MDRFWIIVAHRAGARIFRINRRGESLHPVQELEHPEGRLQARELGSDRPGRVFGSGNMERHGLSGQQGPEQHLAEEFCRKIAEIVEDARSHQRFQNLLVVAEPHILGGIRNQLNDSCRALVSGTLDKNLARLSVRELEAHLIPLVEDAFSSSPLDLSA